MYAGGMSVGHLPEAGGAGDQAATMLDAFAVLSTAHSELHPGND